MTTSNGLLYTAVIKSTGQQYHVTVVKNPNHPNPPSSPERGQVLESTPLRSGWSKFFVAAGEALESKGWLVVGPWVADDSAYYTPVVPEGWGAESWPPLMWNTQ